MGFLDDIMEGAGRVAADFTGSNPAAKQLSDLNKFAWSQGFSGGALQPEFAEAFPDLAADYKRVAASVGASTDPTSPPSGPLAGIESAVGSRPGSLTQAAQDATNVGQASIGTGLARPAGGLARRAGSLEEAAAARPGPNRYETINPQQGALPTGGGAPSGLPQGGIPYPTAPAGGTVPSTAANVPGSGSRPPGGAGSPPSGGPLATQGSGGPLATIPGAPPQGNIIDDMWNWARNHPVIVGGLGAASVAGGMGAAAATLGPRQDGAGAAGTPSTGPDMNFAPGLGMEQGVANMESEAARQRRIDRTKMSPNQSAELDLVEAQAAFARSQHAELDRKVANMDLTDSEKEHLHAQLQAKLDEANNAARAEDTSIRERGATARNDADIASRERTTGMTESGANRRSDNEIASRERTTGMTEAGANSRARLGADVEMRGQDQRARDAQDQFVVQSIANQVASGRLSLEKANGMRDAYFSRAKLPSEILKSVSDAIAPMLPYMRNGNPGDTPAGFEKGGSYDQLAKMAGVKNRKPRAGYSDFNLMDLAAKYGGGAPAEIPYVPTPEEMYGNIPTVDATDPNLAAGLRQQSASTTQLPRPQQQGIPPAVQGLMPTTMVPPMDEGAQSRIYNSLGR